MVHNPCYLPLASFLTTHPTDISTALGTQTHQKRWHPPPLLSSLLILSLVDSKDRNGAWTSIGLSIPHERHDACIVDRDKQPASRLSRKQIKVKMTAKNMSTSLLLPRFSYHTSLLTKVHQANGTRRLLWVRSVVVMTVRASDERLLDASLAIHVKRIINKGSFDAINEKNVKPNVKEAIQTDKVRNGSDDDANQNQRQEKGSHKAHRTMLNFHLLFHDLHVYISDAS